jgi:hypothetical protein
MALLGRTKTPIDKAERELSDFVARRELLEQKLATARTALESATDVRRTSLLDADLSDEEACRRRDAVVRDAKDQVEALTDALAEIGSKITDAEAKLAAMRKAAEAEAFYTRTNASVDALVEKSAVFANASKELVTALEPVLGAIPNPDFGPRLFEMLRVIPQAIDEAVSFARHHALQVKSGAVPLQLPPIVPEPEPKPVAEPIERQKIYTLANISWREGTQIITRSRYSWADPPKHLAEAACERNLADVPDSMRTATLTQSFGINGGPGPMVDQCINLDTLDMPAEVRSVPRHHFEERIGTPVTGTIGI